MSVPVFEDMFIPSGNGLSTPSSELSLWFGKKFDCEDELASRQARQPLGLLRPSCSSPDVDNTSVQSIFNGPPSAELLSGSDVPCVEKCKGRFTSDTMPALLGSRCPRYAAGANYQDPNIVLDEQVVSGSVCVNEHQDVSMLGTSVVSVGNLFLSRSPFVDASSFCGKRNEEHRDCPRCRRVCFRDFTMSDAVICAWCFFESDDENSCWFCWVCSASTGCLGQDDYHYDGFKCRDMRRTTGSQDVCDEFEQSLLMYL